MVFEKIVQRNLILNDLSILVKVFEENPMLFPLSRVADANIIEKSEKRKLRPFVARSSFAKLESWRFNRSRSKKEIINLPFVKLDLPSIDKKEKKTGAGGEGRVILTRKKIHVIECWKERRRKRRRGKGAGPI